MKTSTFLLLSAIVVAGTWYMMQQAEQNKQIGTERYGNLSAGAKQTIKNTIQLSAYKYTDLNDMSQYIGDTLDRLYAQSWQVYIFAESCDIVGAWTKNVYYNHWALLSNFGPKDYCYFIFKTIKCKASTAVTLYKQSNGQQWGNSITPSERTRIKALIQQASIRHSQPQDNTKYIGQRMGSTYWTVVTGHPSKGEFGFYACILNDYWALLWDLGAYNWSYILNRYN